MNLKKLTVAAQKPPLYERGDSIMWTDPHISKQLLEIHLNPELDAASRSPESIEKTIDFVLDFCDRPQMEILDLGCGPGLYCEKLAEKGHRVTGVDFSKNSIDYARGSAEEKNLKVNYFHKNYLDLDFENQFDLVILIYTDFGVLLPSERETLLENVYRALKPGGVFLFDVINDRNIKQMFQEQQTWSIEKGGFWKPEPYLELRNGFSYPEEKVFLFQHTIIDESEQINNYRFWTHYFSPKDMLKILAKPKFSDPEYFENILPANSVWDGDNVTFYKCAKG